MATAPPPHKASRRAQLQRQLGEIGTVLERVPRAGGRYRWQGWYAEIGGELVYLGDHFPGACAMIDRMLEPDE